MLKNKKKVVFGFGQFYLISTQIGNLEDITIRAKRILSEVDVIFAEDTRITKKMLSSLDIDNNNLVSYFEENELKRIPEIIKLLKQGKNIGLVSNAGTPLISDPGFKLVNRLVQEGIKIIPIPGPSALISSLVSSGFHPDHFVFLGFMPKKTGKKKKLFDEIKKISPDLIPTVCFYDSPFRLKKTLELVFDLFGNVKISIGREMTKMHEEFIRGRVKEILKEMNQPLRGEVTVVINIKDK